MSMVFQIYNTEGVLVFDIDTHRLMRHYKTITIDPSAWTLGENSYIWYYVLPEANPANMLAAADYVTCKVGKLQYWNAYNSANTRPPKLTVNIYRF